MRLALRNGLLYVPVKLFYHSSVIPLAALIDTGSAGTAVDINLIKVDFTRETVFRDLVGVGGRQRVIVQRVEGVEIGEHRVSDLPLELCDMDEEFGIQAILGGDVLKALNAVVDYGAQEMRFSV